MSLWLASLILALAAHGESAEELGKRFDGTAPLRDAVSAIPVTQFAYLAPKAALEAPSYDYDRMFDLSRRLLSGPQGPRVRDFLRDAFAKELTLSPEQQEEFGLPDRIKEVSESQLMLLLQQNQAYWPLLETYLDEMSHVRAGSQHETEVRRVWRGRMRSLIRGERLKHDFQQLNDPLQPMALDQPDGRPGYEKARVFVDHRGWRDGHWTQPDDLVKVAVDFIKGAKKELMLNVFDFDLMEVADAIVEKAASGVPVTVGIDKRVIEQRPEVKAVYLKLKKAKNVSAVAVDAVGLNHQKMMSRDWSDPKAARVLLSSGNLTRSCLSPGGDLADRANRPRDAVPNANHMITLDSFPAAQAVADSLIKTLQLKLRGGDYPLAGAFKVSGSDPASFMALAFSPRGGLGEVNRDVIRRILLQTRGPIRMLQFAFSSEEVVAALLERARLEKAEGGSFDFKSVGDKPFAVAPWSAFLTLSGYRLVDQDGKKRYEPLENNPLRDLLGAQDYELLKQNIRVAPSRYSKHSFKSPDGDVAYDAKLHHKVLISGNVVIAGTSFNISSNAEGNNEQMIVFKDPEIVASLAAAFEGLYRQTSVSVEQEALKRNSRRISEGFTDEDGAFRE